MIDNPLEDIRTKLIEKPTTLDIVSALLNDDNIEMKTEIINPYALDTLMIFAHLFKKHGQKGAYNILKKWKNLLLRYMVSHDRLSRTEVKEILKGYFALEQKSKDVSLTSNLAKINQQNSF